MKEAEYLLEKYYKPMGGSCPTLEDLQRMVDIKKDKLVVVRAGKKIVGMAMFLTLTKQTIDQIDQLDLEDTDLLMRLLAEDGPHIHFILVTAEGYRVIMAGIRAVLEQRTAESLSWKDFEDKVHKYDLRRKHVKSR